MNKTILKITLILCITSFLVIINTKEVKCNEINYIYYYQENENGLYFEKEEISLLNESVEVKLNKTLEELFNKENTIAIPKDVKLLDLYFVKQNLVININENILSYGGDYYERLFLSQIFKNCFQYNNVDTIILLTNGNVKSFPKEENKFLIYKYEDLSCSYK